MQTILDGGFADPVLQSQTAFRAVMNALANPGVPQVLPSGNSASHAMSAEMVTILLTLCDHDSSVWLDEKLRADKALADFLGFHTSAPLVHAPEKAAFAFSSGAKYLPGFDKFNLGTQEYPDRSTTIVLALAALAGGPTLTLRGPGIRDTIHIGPRGLPEDFVTQWTENRQQFPRGIDLLLVADGQLVGLPRTTRITHGG